MQIEIIDSRQDVRPDALQTAKVFKIIGQARKAGRITISAQGSSRSGKTYNILLWLIVYALKNAGVRISIVRATLPALKRSTLVDFRDIMQKMGIYDEGVFNKSELVYSFGNGSWIEFFSADSEQKLRGSKRDVLYVNEANELKFIQWQQLKMRTTRFAILDYNPSFTDEHWICGVNKEPKTYHFVSTYRDNPFLEQTVIDEIESLQHKNRSLWQIYGLGEQAAVEGLIFTNIEVVDEMPVMAKRRYIGLDFGYTHDPTAIVEVAVFGDCLYIDEVCYRTRMLVSDIIAELRLYAGRKAIAESADPRLIDEIYNAGINIHPVVKGSGSVMEGISKMLEYRICITSRSVNVIKEFRSYAYAQDKDGKFLNYPIDANNHAIDAVRYVVLTEVLGKNRRRRDLKGIFY